MSEVLDYSLMVAPNGARRTSAEHPSLPVTAADLARTARACQSEGATAIHVHVRDNQERHSLDAGRYREAIAAIVEYAPGLGVQITTESAGLYQPAEQLACLTRLRPGAASIAVREMAAEPSIAKTTYAFAHEASIEVQHIVYTPGCIAQLLAWREAGLVRPEQCRVLVVLGQYAPPRDAAPADLDPLALGLKGHGLPLSVCAFGRNEHLCLRDAAARGYGVRLGFENSVCDAQGVPHRDNAASVRAYRKQLSAVVL
ncbi:MAG: 3-keto-5-aminohexanoate cleavage protein [Alphaproteobacteria bacterium]|nr:3-keto-5-aminohexanoate cleavage protein [Alphaproteobacteria bacterium]